MLNFIHIQYVLILITNKLGGKIWVRFTCECIRWRFAVKRELIMAPSIEPTANYIRGSIEFNRRKWKLAQSKIELMQVSPSKSFLRVFKFCKMYFWNRAEHIFFKFFIQRVIKYTFDSFSSMLQILWLFSSADTINSYNFCIISR